MAQYKVSLGVLSERMTKNFKLWIFTKEQLAGLIAAWDVMDIRWIKVRDDAENRPARHTYYHPTAMYRGKWGVPKPMEVALQIDSKLGRGQILNFGCGREAGSHVLESRDCCEYIRNYDPYHPDAQVRVLPLDGFYDVVHCHYVLNVVDAAEGKEILKQILSSMNSEGVAAISVREDL